VQLRLGPGQGRANRGITIIPMSVLCASWGQADVCLLKKKFIRHRMCWWYMAHVQPSDVLTGSRKTPLPESRCTQASVEKGTVPDKRESVTTASHVGGNATRWSGQTSPTERTT